MPTVTTVEPAVSPAGVPAGAPPPTPTATDSRRSRLSPRARFAFLVLGIAAAGAVAVRLLPFLIHAPVPGVVFASGRIEGRQVTLAPKDIQGRVKRLFVDEGAAVKHGQVLAELEAKQLDSRHAALVATLANLDVQIHQAALDVKFTTAGTTAAASAARAAVNAASAHVARATAIEADARIEYERSLGLFKAGVLPQSTLDQSEMSWRTSQADVDASDKELAQAQSNLAVAQNSQEAVELKRQQVRALQETRRSVVAQIAEAEAYLAERTIVAPSDGTILSRPVEVGDVVSPGSPMFVMVDMNRLYVKVYIPEPDVAKLRLGDPADVSVDAFPGRTFPARVTKIYQQAEFTPKNVETQEERLKLVFGVELTFVQPEGLLKPGMPADGAIHWTAAEQSRHAP